MRAVAWILCVLGVLVQPQASSAQSVEDDRNEREAAQAAFVAGDLDAAQAILDRLLADSPNDTDLLRRIANVQAARGNLDAAIETIDRALELAPDDADLQLARARILLWDGRISKAREQAEAVARTRPGYPGLDETLAAVERRREQQRIVPFSAGVGGSVSRATFRNGEARTWSTATGAVALSFGPKARASVEVEHEDRGITDTRVASRLDLLGNDGNFFVTASLTPHADFRERWSLGAGAEKPMGERTALIADARYASYRVGEVLASALGVRQRLGKDFFVTLRSIQLFGGGEDLRLGGSVRLDHAPDSGVGWTISAASYPDTELDGTRRLDAVGAGLVVPLSARLTLRANGDYEQREGSYKRKSIAVGIGWRFGQQ